MGCGVGDPPNAKTIKKKKKKKKKVFNFFLEFNVFDLNAPEFFS